MDKPRLHVLILPEFLPFHEKGWGSFTWNYINCISPFCKVTVFHSRLNGNEVGLYDFIIDENVKVFRYFPYKNKPKGLRKIIAYQKWIRDCFKILKGHDKYDIIHAHGAVLNGSLAKKLSKYWNIPYVVTEHTGPFSFVVKGVFKPFLVKKIMENANAVLLVSNHLKKEIMDTNIRPKRIEITYNPVNTELFLLKEDKLFKNIVFAGRLDENKGGLRAVKAFKIFHKTNPEWTFTMCGDGREMNAIKNYISSHQLEKNIIMKGMLKEKEVNEEFRHADIFFSPTQFESFGMAIAEAMACGLPVVTTNKTAPKEYVNDSCGVLINVDNIDEMANSLSEMVLNINQYNSNNIRKNVVNRFSYNNFGNNLFTIYKSLLTNK